jgi:hypothetical protein
MSTAPDPFARQTAVTHYPWGECIEIVARALLGEPNASLSKPGDMRFGNKGSVSVNTFDGTWYDHEAGKGGGVLDLIEHKLHLTGRTAFEWMASIGCQVDADRANGVKYASTPAKAVTTDTDKKELLAAYDYVDEAGKLVFQTRRIGFRKADGTLRLGEDGKPAKTFSQRRPDPDKAGGWIYDLKGVTKFIPYHLPELIEAIAGGHPVLIVEGEQKADLLATWKLIATCNAEGAGKWSAEHAAYLRDVDAVILPDNDEAGRKHAEAVAASLQGIAARVRILELPNLVPKGDIVDWSKAGGTREQLDALIEQLGEGRAPAPAPSSASYTPTTGLRFFKSMELNVMRFEPIKYVVPGIIVEGLTLLAAKPKIGKSWLALHAAMAVATVNGGYTLGEIHCAEGDVLYCALEDNPRRLQSRMTKLVGGTRSWPPRLTFLCEMPRLAEGGLDVIKQWIKSVAAPRMVIIDTLAMVKAPKKLAETGYDADYNAVKELRALANQYGIAILLIHHQRKAEADDAFDTVSGTLGLTGAVDTILIIKRDSSGNMVLHGRGRDLVEIEKALAFNADACTWTIAGEVSEVRASNARKNILAAMREIELPASPAAIATAADMKAVNVRKRLAKMAEDGLVEKADYGKYTLAPQKTE